MRVAKILLGGVAASLLLWGPSLAMTTNGAWIKDGPNNVGLYKTAPGYVEYMPSTQVAQSLREGLPKDYARPVPMNAAQTQTGVRIAAALHDAFVDIGL